MNSQALYQTLILSKADNKVITNVIAIVICSIAIAVSAHLSIFMPIVSPVAFTLQTFVVALISLTMGRKIATASVILYIIDGLLGLPVFSVGSIATVGASTGYILGFIPMAYVIGMFADSGFANTKRGMLVTLFVGNMIVYAFGSIWMMTFLHLDLVSVLKLAVLPFIFIDTIKALAAVVLSKGLNKKFNA